MTNKTIAKRQGKEKQLLLENLKRIPIIEVACNKSNIGRTTFYRWKKDDKEFARLADEALSEGCGLVNDMSENQIISAIKDGNLTACFYWLNHRHAAYGNKVEISTNTIAQEALSPEQQEAVKKALVLTGLAEKESK